MPVLQTPKFLSIFSLSESKNFRVYTSPLVTTGTIQIFADIPLDLLGLFKSRTHLAMIAFTGRKLEDAMILHSMHRGDGYQSFLEDIEYQGPTILVAPWTTARFIKRTFLNHQINILEYGKNGEQETRFCRLYNMPQGVCCIEEEPISQN